MWTEFPCRANQHPKNTIKKKKSWPCLIKQTFHTFSLLDLRFVLFTCCSRVVNVLRAQRIIGSFLSKLPTNQRSQKIRSHGSYFVKCDFACVCVKEVSSFRFVRGTEISYKYSGNILEINFPYYGRGPVFSVVCIFMIMKLKHIYCNVKMFLLLFVLFIYRMDSVIDELCQDSDCTLWGITLAWITNPLGMQASVL